MINTSVDIEIFNNPWCWAMSDKLLTKEDAKTLSEEFPFEKYQLSERLSGSDKEYRSYQRVIYSECDRGRHLITDNNDFTPTYNELFKTLTSSEYRKYIERLFSTDLSENKLEIILNIYSSGCYITPHTDCFPKNITHLIYLNQGYSSSFGGGFNIMTSPFDVYKTVEPVNGRSAFIKRSDISWHEVSQVNHKEFVRKSIQIIFWENEPNPVIPGRTMHEACIK
jgi:Rps23 Pro-64 3,4-dihydroxylase Tpa1-like proline 4-hydroxylase